MSAAALLELVTTVTGVHVAEVGIGPEPGFRAADRTLCLLFAAYEPVSGATQNNAMPLNKRTAPRVTRAVIGCEEFFFMAKDWLSKQDHLFPAFAGNYH